MKNVLWICTEVGGVNYFRAKMPHDAIKTYCKKYDPAIVHYDPELTQRINWENELYTDRAGAIKSDLSLAVGWADIVIWMGLHTPESLLFFKWCKLRYPHVKMVMEIDDYLLSSARCNTAAGEVYKYGGDLAKVGLEQMKLSDGLIVTTVSLAELYKPYAKKIYVVENVADLKVWPKRAKNKRLTVGWIGAGSHDDDLALIKDVVPAILQKYHNVEFSIVHGAPEFFKHKPGCEYLLNPRHHLYKKMRRCTKCHGIDRLHWTHDFKSIDKYPKWAASFGFDIGLAPLVDLNFTRGKSNLRWLEYSAMGVPTIASPINHFRESIRDGETGLIVKDNSPQGWMDSIELLINDEALRKKIGKAARKEIKDKWSLKVMAQKYRTALEGISNAVDDKSRPGDADRPTGGRSEQSEVFIFSEAV